MDKMFQLLETVLTPLIFTAVGGFLLWLALYFCRRTKRFIGESLWTHGEVIGLHEVYDEGSITYAPIISFTTADGRGRKFTDTVSSRPASHGVGDRVEILYHLQNPRDARIATTFRLYFPSIVLGLIGGAFFSIGAAVTIWCLFSQG
jgi:hypothetical protein